MALQQRRYVPKPNRATIRTGCRNTSLVVMSPWIAMTWSSSPVLEAITCHCRANADRASGTRIGALEPEISGLQRPGLMAARHLSVRERDNRGGAASRYR